ncbi:Methyltransferase type 12 [Magnetococcus marinus MC-1]|uniref:Methyltransferase type 12 n=1 Tax=Magnetococcus marinus (strain ATCC BAA-1437 / JCM 17883 / MC-1) TaxID=156889 RepID=A0LAI3_MAGMM|nr:methyltransferase domain-containing protein [Magnetococcus marinus]ABK44976.1 Methyltransferase type 12 [Magnetococcus marinus MC-1]
MAGEELKQKQSSYYAGVRPEIVEMVPQRCKRILDVGCAAGGLGAALKARGAEYVAGIEFNREAATMAEQQLDHVLVGDVENLELPYELGSFDCMVYADILEHLVNPTRLLQRHVPYLAEGGCVVTSIPNIRYFKVLERMVDGFWTYTDSGILDRDHLRFFTIREMLDMLGQAGLKASFLGETWNEEGAELDKGPYPKDITVGRLTLHNQNEFEVHDLFVFQYLIRAQHA